MSWFGTQPAPLRKELGKTSPMLAGSRLVLAGAGIPETHTRSIRGARHRKRGPGASRYLQLGHVRDKRRGEPPVTPPAGRHTPSGPFATGADRASHLEGSRGRPGVVIVASPSDLLAQLVATSLLYAHVPTCQLDPSDLGEVELEWHGDQITINGHRISGLLWRAMQGSPSRVLDPRTTASWLAAASFPSMRAVNAYDPTAWRRGAGWSVWKDRLDECGVAVQPPPDRRSASSGSHSLVVCGAVVAGPETPCIAAVSEALESSGVRLASVTSLPSGRVCGVDAQPQVDDSVEARRAAARIANYLAA
ncbi:MAG: hypothetical protein HKO63_04040 [Acidimicrobiia bacterium]|nr:hypothetical protein [Acidimicrobiia bacterium]NNF88450.1 hypothetical protein [Acidimicrobiia bacterium]NNL97354.1 hypothetical protein [Acidimicrobiia bacterium]